MAKKKIPDKYLPWIEARKRFHLSDAHIQMARELGLNPKKFGGLANTKQEPWKLPLPEFVEELYFQHFKRRRPKNVRSIEQIVRDSNRKKAERRARKQAARLLQQSSEDSLPPQQRRSLLLGLRLYLTSCFLIPRPRLPPIVPFRLAKGPLIQSPAAPGQLDSVRISVNLRASLHSWKLILSEKEDTLSDIMPRPRTYNSTADRIRKRVQKDGPDTVFHAGQFLDLDTRTAVDKALSRLVTSGFLRRLARGLYYQPKQHHVLGDILPPVEAVARALADRDHVRLQPFGGYAANLLRLSDQVPAHVVFLTDGKPRKMRYGKQVIELRRVSPRMMAAAGRMTGLLIAGLRYVGKANVTPERVAHLRKMLSPEDRRRLIEDISLAPAWMHPHFRAIAQEEDPS